MLKLNITQNGFDVFNNNPLDISEQHQLEFDKAINDKKLKVRGDDISVITELSEFKNFLDLKKKIVEILNENKILNLKFEDIWIQKKTYSEYLPNKLPNIPHIDKVRKFKVMVYLNPVTLSNGPINLLKINPENYEDKRKNLKNDYKLNQENQIFDYDKKDYFACLGPLGTTIFFDTNTPHFAGSFRDNSNELFRKTLRFNFLKN